MGWNEMDCLVDGNETLLIFYPRIMDGTTPRETTRSNYKCQSVGELLLCKSPLLKLLPSGKHPFSTFFLALFCLVSFPLDQVTLFLNRRIYTLNCSR